ncbi:MAG: hypothetical protein HZB26_18250 [Candidatus Hydrogenedentes bacterium]|nr:hypothetical protein [Candidatus Hydrogenedentota bacterium]
MAYIRARWVLGKNGLPWLQQDENVLFSSGELWYYRYRLRPWSFGAGTPFPTISNTFHVTDHRAVLVVQHCRLFQFELSQWRSASNAPAKAEIIQSVELKEAPFGSGFLEFSGFTGPYGLFRLPFAKKTGRVHFLEIVSGCPGAPQSRTVQIYTGKDPEADERLEAAHRALTEA